MAGHARRSKELAHRFKSPQYVIFLGRGINDPIALLAPKVPVVSIAVGGSVFDKVLRNAKESKARDAQMIDVVPADPDTELFDVLVLVPEFDELLSPLLTVVQMQLLLYHIAAYRGLDVDQPPNLIDSITVE